jgi:hypothetical protein
MLKIDSRVNTNLSNSPATGGRFLLAMTMFMTYPMEFFVTRFAIISTIQRRWKSVDHKDNVPHYSVTAALWIVTTLMGTFSTDLGIILDVTGSVAAVFLAFILPGWLSIKLDNMRFFSLAAMKQSILIVVGAIFMIVSSLLILLREVHVVSGEFHLATAFVCFSLVFFFLMYHALSHAFIANTPHHCKFE